MVDCCQTTTNQISNVTVCPACNQKGKSVPVITLKSLLKPSALETIQPESTYSFCPTPVCEVVYFNGSQTFSTDTLKVSVFQKDSATDVPVCYCFDWTRKRLIQSVQQQESKRPIDHISEQVQDNRCGCEVNNPQGSCCLGNVVAFVKSIDRI
jgi:hypothetical protein